MLFCDLAGFTARSDGVMAVFGIPGHEDDPERAVRCGLAMAEAIQELNREQPDLDLAVRIGLTTGEGRT